MYPQHDTQSILLRLKVHLQKISTIRQAIGRLQYAFLELFKEILRRIGIFRG
ncbi:MAG: hypothetical protein JW736_01385 [Deltaproteobacteria bacterium]|nr:hypothetical protein [Deltaproteobacteria bacterium]